MHSSVRMRFCCYMTFSRSSCVSVPAPFPLLACSLRSMCLGLPYVAWLAALQRQRVMAKHGLAVTNEEAWATACYPCSLLQMHALLQQQYQQQQGLLHSHHSQQQQQTASVPLRAPRVQQMTGALIHRH